MSEVTGPPGEILLSKDEIHERIQELGTAITEDYAGRAPLFIGVLKGAFVFMADLARAVDLPVEFDFMAVSSYGDATRTSGVVRIVKDLDVDLTGRDVVVVEDIIDSGLTLNYLRRNLQSRAPASLEVCALLVRSGRQAEDLGLKYVGFDIPPRFRRRVWPRCGRALPQPASSVSLRGLISSAGRS